MRIPSGKTDQNIYFVAYDSSDHTTRKTGLSSFTVYRSRNNGSATAYTTPTVSELDAVNMPGVYALLVDEDSTIASGSDSEEYCVHITKAGMDPVTRTIELYRRDTTSGRTLDVSAGGEAGLDWGNVGSPTTTLDLSGTTISTSQAIASVSGAVGSVTGAVGSVTGNVGGNLTGSIGSLSTQAKADVNAEADTALADAGVTTTVTGRIDVAVSTRLASVSYTAPDSAATIADAVWDEDATAHQTQGTFGQAIGDPGADTDTIFGLVNTNLDATVSSRLASGSYTAPDNSSITAIKAKTDNLPTDPADESLVIAATDAIAALIGTPAVTVSADVAAVKAVDDAIKAKTDSLTYTVAGQVDANIQSVNDVTVTGTGAPSDEWGPP